MTNDEKNALLLYMECRLFDFCTQIEQNSKTGDIGCIYDNMYVILSDMDETLEVYMDLTSSENTKKGT